MTPGPCVYIHGPQLARVIVFWKLASRHISFFRFLHFYLYVYVCFRVCTGVQGPMKTRGIGSCKLLDVGAETLKVQCNVFFLSVLGLFDRVSWSVLEPSL